MLRDESFFFFERGWVGDWAIFWGMNCVSRHLITGFSVYNFLVGIGLR